MRVPGCILVTLYGLFWAREGSHLFSTSALVLITMVISHLLLWWKFPYGIEEKVTKCASTESPGSVLAQATCSFTAGGYPRKTLQVLPRANTAKF